MPLDQGREGALARLPAPVAELFQQLPVRQPAGRPRPEQRLDVPEGAAESALCHRSFPSPAVESLTLSCRAAAGLVRLFGKMRRIDPVPVARIVGA